MQLPAFDLHPEELEDLQINLAKSLLARFRADSATEDQGPVVHKRMQADALALIERSFAEVGEKGTLRGLLRVLTGQDLLDQVRPVLIRLCAAHLDEGLAAWSLPGRHEGLYAAWRRLAGSDLAWSFAGLSGWRAALTRWPEQPLDAIVAELRRLGPVSYTHLDVYKRQLLAQFDRSTAAIQLVEQVVWSSTIGVSYALGVDGLSLPMVLLTTLLVGVALLASDRIKTGVKGYYAWMLVLEFAMLGVFMAQDWTCLLYTSRCV